MRKSAHCLFGRPHLTFDKLYLPFAVQENLFLYLYTSSNSFPFVIRLFPGTVLLFIFRSFNMASASQTQVCSLLEQVHLSFVLFRLTALLKPIKTCTYINHILNGLILGIKIA